MMMMMMMMVTTTGLGLRIEIVEVPETVGIVVTKQS